MTVGVSVTTITDNEQLARFVLHKDLIRQDDTVRPAAFIPYRYVELSVTRHIGLSDLQIWDLGKGVAIKQNKKLYGRADVLAANVRKIKLEAVPDPIPENPNHAEIWGWPADKPSQMSFAQQLAAESKYVVNPE